jgi:hypothetical protein
VSGGQRPDADQRARRQAALLSLAFHTLPAEFLAGLPGTSLLPDYLRPMTLESAIELLASDRGPGASPLGAFLAGSLRARRPDVAWATGLLAEAPRRPAVKDFLVLPSFDPKSFVTRVEVRLKVKRAIDGALAARCDPRAWGRDSQFFVESTRYVPSGSWFAADPAPSACGTPWSGLLFEHVCMNTGTPGAVEFQNLLNIDFRVEPGRSIEFDYSLFACLRSQLWGVARRGGIDVDSGIFQASAVEEEGEPWTDIRAVKRIRYTDFVPTSGLSAPGFAQPLNYLAPALVSAWLALLVYEGAST